MSPEVISTPRGGIADLSFDTGTYTDNSGNTYTVYFPKCENIHPLWRLVQVDFNGWIDFDSPRTEDRPYVGTIGSLPIGSAYDAYNNNFFSGRDSVRGRTYEPRNITFYFRHSTSGKVIVTETSPKKIIVSNGKVAIDR